MTAQVTPPRCLESYRPTRWQDDGKCGRSSPTTIGERADGVKFVTRGSTAKSFTQWSNGRSQVVLLPAFFPAIRQESIP
jgi:hypothetical protein